MQRNQYTCIWLEKSSDWPKKWSHKSLCFGILCDTSLMSCWKHDNINYPKQHFVSKKCWMLSWWVILCDVSEELELPTDTNQWDIYVSFINSSTNSVMIRLVGEKYSVCTSNISEKFHLLFAHHSVFILLKLLSTIGISALKMLVLWPCETVALVYPFIIVVYLLIIYIQWILF